jgi:hypothetical protein
LKWRKGEKEVINDAEEDGRVRGKEDEKRIGGEDGGEADRRMGRNGKR